MPNWIITIKGMGATHLGRKSDADALVKAFIALLEKNDHEVEDARFTLTDYDFNPLVQEDWIKGWPSSV